MISVYSVSLHVDLVPRPPPPDDLFNAHTRKEGEPGDDVY